MDRSIISYNNLIVSFEMIFNTDLGLCKLLLKEYNNPKFINLYINLKYEYLVSELRDRVTLNPLYLFLKEEYSDKADELYNEFKTSKESKILEYSKFYLTGFSGLLKVWCTFEELKATIVCKNQIQKDMVDEWINKEENPSIKSIIFPNEENPFLPSFDTIILKNYAELDWIGWFEGKNLYLSDELYNNAIINIDAKNILSKYIKYNDIHNISLYSNDIYKNING